MCTSRAERNLVPAPALAAVRRLAVRERGWVRDLEAWLLDSGQANPTPSREGLGAIGRRVRNELVALEDYSASRGVRVQAPGRLPIPRRDASPATLGRRLRHLRFVLRRLRREVGDVIAEAHARGDLAAAIRLRTLARLHGDADRILVSLQEQCGGATRGLAA